MLAVEQGRGDGDITVGGKPVAHLLDVLVDPKDFLDDDDGGPANALAGGGMADIGHHVQTLVTVHVVKSAVTTEP